MKKAGKAVYLITLIMLLTSGCNNAFFEVDTKVTLKEGASPPVFYITGNGTSPIFLVFGPYEGNYGKDGNPPPLWELDPEPAARGIEVNKYSPFTYGQLPSGYIQGKPKENRIPELLEGKEYSFYIHVNSANGGGTCFRIQDGKAAGCKKGA